MRGYPRERRPWLPLVGAICLLALTAGCGGVEEQSERATSSESAPPTEAAGATATGLSAAKSFLGDHTDRLIESTQELNRLAARYNELTNGGEGDLEGLWEERSGEIGSLLMAMKAAWVEANPNYERVEGLVAGTPSLAEYDVIIDAGSSAAEDPESAVPFDLTLPDGTVLEQPGNLFNLTEGALWGTLPEELNRPGTPADLDGDGRTEFGEVLPDSALLLAATETFVQYAEELDAAGEAWEPTPSDAFTALVVMVPTMSEYFEQWKLSRFVAGEAADAEAFNVVSRLADIRDILTGLEVIYDGVEPAVSEVDQQQAAQTGQELSALRSFIADLHDREQAGNRLGRQPLLRGSSLPSFGSRSQTPSAR